MTVVNVWVGRVTASGARVRTKSTGLAVRLAVDTDPALSAPTLYNATGDADDIWTFDPSGLASDTQYYYAVEEDGVLDTAFPGAFRTFPATGTQASFAFAASGDAGGDPDFPGVGAVLDANRVSNAPVFDTIRQHSATPLFFCHLGDLTYYNLGSGATFPGTLDNYRRQIDDVLLQPRQHELYRSIPLVYTWDDHDYGPNNSDGTLPDKDNAATAYRERVPSYTLPDTGGAIYHAWQVGRVQFVVWDTRFYRTPSGQPDDGGKTMLGTDQKAWFRTLLETSTAEALVVVSSVHWILTTSDNESWGSYSTERQEIADMLTSTGWANRMIMLCADRHAIMMDSGQGNQWGGFPTYGFASLDATPHAGPWPHNLGSSAARDQYGIVQVTDNGDEITFTSRGWQGGTAVLSHTHTITVTAPTDPGTVTPNVPVTPGVARQSVTWLACNLVSGDIIAELPEMEGEVSRVIGEYTSSSIKMPIPYGGPGATPTTVWEQATAPGQTMIVPVVNDVPAAGFIVLACKGGTEATLELGCVSLEGYLRRRYVGDHSWTQQDEASVIAAGLVADAQPEGINLVIDAPPTGRLRDRDYLDIDDGTVFDRLAELMAVRGGPEWTIDVDWADDTRRSVQKIFRVRKRIGVANPNAVFSTEGAADATYSYSVDYSDGKGANHIIASSSGEGDDRPQSPAIEDVLPGWPRYERRFSPGSSIKRASVLTDHAQAELDLRRDGSRTWEVTARWDAWPRLNIDWRMGDDITLELTGHRHPFGTTVVRRCIGWSLDMQAGTVTPILLEVE